MSVKNMSRDQLVTIEHWCGIIYDRAQFLSAYYEQPDPCEWTEQDHLRAHLMIWLKTGEEINGGDQALELINCCEWEISLLDDAENDNLKTVMIMQVQGDWS